MSCIWFCHFLDLILGVFVNLLHLKMSALAFQVVSFEDVCNLHFIQLSVVHLCSFHFFAESRAESR